MSKYNDNPSLNLLLERQAFKRFSEIDIDADGLISFEETLGFVNKQKESTNGNSSLKVKHRLEHLRQINSSTIRRFEEVDTNLNGYIEPEEFDQELSQR